MYSLSILETSAKVTFLSQWICGFAEVGLKVDVMFGSIGVTGEHQRSHIPSHREICFEVWLLLPGLTGLLHEEGLWVSQYLLSGELTVGFRQIRARWCTLQLS